ncbi:MAG: hypothetical protein LBQ49_02070, partial [Rickettsiales bacterium]|nr:hypothetical protein [Rickettsiales bacterium]
IEALYAESSVDEQTPALQTDETKRLGNVRTGLMATGAAINAAGAVMAANGGPKNLKDMIAGCRGALLVLDSELTRLRVANEADANDPKFARAEKIVAECGRLSEINVAKIDQKANVVKLAAGAGAAMAIAGAITSALANSDKTNRTDGARKNLDSASNALAVGMTAASGVSTGFNAALIAEYDKALKTAEKCGETLE